MRRKLIMSASIGSAYGKLPLFGIYISNCRRESRASQPAHPTDMSRPERLERLSALDTNTVSDALDFLSLPGATFGLRPLWDCPKIVGRASTVQLGPKTG